MEDFFSYLPALGTLVNALAVVAGSTAGLFIRSRLPEKLMKAIFQSIGLFTLFLGIHMASQTGNFLVLIFSLVLGSLAGEMIDLDGLLQKFGEGLKNRFSQGSDHFVEGFITASLLFCTGSMAILGAIEEGLGGFPNLLFAKSLLDGVSSLALAASLGLGVLFAALPLLVYQGGITLFASAAQAYLSQAVIDEMSAVGGLILLGLGLVILDIKVIKVTNMLPGLVLAALMAAFFL
jgi:uncharacterized membrane protein YqgA involved in biofilm formation